MNHEERIFNAAFNAAILLHAHRDVSLDQAVRFAEKILEQSVKAAIVYEKTEDCTCTACCQKEMYVSEKDDGEDDITLEECIQRGYLLDK